MKKMWVDPPEGNKFGFPKEFDFVPSHPNLPGEEYEKEFRKWFLDNGYPICYIHKGYLNYCRYQPYDEKGEQMKIVLDVEQKRAFIKDKVQNEANSNFCTIEFVKKDGTDRVMNIQYAAMIPRLKGDEAAPSRKKAVETRKVNHPELFAVYDVQKKQIRMVNLDTVFKLTVSGHTYEFPREEAVKANLTNKGLM